MDFSPSRMRAARHRRGQTFKGLASAMGMSDRIVRSYERGERLPTEDALVRLADALQVPKSYLFGDSFEDLLSDEERPVSFRARRSTSARKRKSALASGQYAIDIARYIDTKFRLPEPQIPDLSVVDPIPERERREAKRGMTSALANRRHAEMAAETLRAAWGLGAGPISNMLHLLEAKGVRVFRLADDVEEVDAFCFWDAEVPFVVLNTSKSGERSRFDAAHELGHLVLHRGRTDFGKPEEAEADAFASAFLMPRDSVLREWPSSPLQSELLRLKPRWKVSMAAMVRRGYDCGRFSEWQYRQAFIHLSASGQRKGELGGLPHETSKVYEQIVRSMQRRKRRISTVADAVDLPAADVWSLLLLPDGIEQTTQLPIKRKSPSNTSGQATILTFPPRR